MPPKGWRKDAQGNYPTKSYIKEQENVTINDLLFPRSTIIQIAKDVHNATHNSTNTNSVANAIDSNNGDTTNDSGNRKLMINKDASIALQRSATVFVNYLLMFAREIAKDSGKKSCNVDDIMMSLDHIGFSGFKSIINDKLIDYQKQKDLKKAEKLKEKTENENNNSVAEIQESSKINDDNTTNSNDDTNNEPTESNKRLKIDSTIKDDDNNNTQL